MEVVEFKYSGAVLPKYGYRGKGKGESSKGQTSKRCVCLRVL